MPQLTRQCFRLTDELMEALSVEEVDLTWQAMQEFGIAKPPAPEFDIIVRARYAVELGNPTDPADMEPHVRAFREHAHYRFGYRDGLPESGQILCEGMRGPEVPPQMVSNSDQAFYNMLVLLIVLMGTTAAQKTVREHKAAKLGIGKHRYAYTTTITIGRVEGDPSAEPGSGGPKRPHFRRAHPRTLHRGTPREWRTLVQACFIHADRDYIESRTSYLVRKAPLATVIPPRDRP